MKMAGRTNEVKQEFFNIKNYQAEIQAKSKIENLGKKEIA
jgi:hypothetical protein